MQYGWMECGQETLSHSIYVPYLTIVGNYVLTIDMYLSISGFGSLKLRIFLFLKIMPSSNSSSE
jgi:hypothetical protein